MVIRTLPLAYSLELNRSKSVTLCVLDQVPANEGTVGGGEKRTKKYPPPPFRKCCCGKYTLVMNPHFSTQGLKNIYPGGGAKGGLGTTAERKT